MSFYLAARYHWALLPVWGISLLRVFRFYQKGFPRRPCSERAGRRPRLPTTGHDKPAGDSRWEPGMQRGLHWTGSTLALQVADMCSFQKGRIWGSRGSVQSPQSAGSATSPGVMTGSPSEQAVPWCDFGHHSFPGIVVPKLDFWPFWRFWAIEGPVIIPSGGK